MNGYQIVDGLGGIKNQARKNNMEIRFRVWDKYRQQFLNPSNVWASLNFSNVFVEKDSEEKIADDNVPNFEWDDFQQYIGEQDVNGVDIYEGDIVSSSNKLFYIKWARAYSGLKFCAVSLDGN